MWSNFIHTYRNIAMFGEFVRELRLEKRLGLREFCQKLQFDPSYWSKIEREVTPPPKSKQQLERIAKLLEIRRGSKDWVELMDRAALGAGKVPSDLLSDSELLERLPLVFRTVRGDKPTVRDLSNLVEKIRGIRGA
jgi:transcriptional regulator with XRE-family HTH domain